MRRSLAVTLAVLVVSSVPNSLSAQRGSFRVTAPSPTAASLGKFGDVPVSLYTGVPDISIPLFTAKGRSLSLPIVLRYHGGGIKVEEKGSWVGIGWTLEAGGTITRTVRGLVDEDLSRGYYYTGNTWYNSANWPTVTNPTIMTQLRDEMIDGEPDQFFFDFMGRSGQFVMGPTGLSGPIEFRSIPYQKLKIVPGLTGNMITSWTITAEDGTVYVFGAAETSTDLTETPGMTDEQSHWGEVHTSSWHLTSITAPDGDAITLTYAGYTATHDMGRSSEKFDFRQVPQGEACVGNRFDVWSRAQIATLRLASITTAAHTITFTPGALRSDALSPTGAAQEPSLGLITVATPPPANVVLRKFSFEYDYSTSRLTLKNVYEQDRNGVSLPPYSFTYDGATLPGTGSPAMDHWGFYNGESGNADGIPQMRVWHLGTIFNLTGAKRGPNPGFARAGLLTKITYPTGGYNELVYEPNDYGSVGAAAITGFVEVGAGPLYATAGPEAEVVEQQFTITSVDPDTTILVKLDFFQDPVGCAGMDDPPCPMTELVGTGGWQTNGQYEVFLPPGTYTLRATTLAWNQQAQITATWSNLVAAPGRIAGGLRVAELRAADALGNVTTRKYRYTLQSDPTRSSGVISDEPRYHYSYWSPGCSYFSRTSMSKLPLGDGAPVAYREVTVLHGTTGQFGMTRHTFRSFFEVVDPAPDGTVWPFSRRTNYAWMRGQETGSTEYNAAGQPQQRIASVHAFQEGEPITERRFRGMSINTFSGGMFGTNYVFNAFEVLSVWSFMAEDTTVVYDEAGTNAFATTRTYTYGNPNHIQLTLLTENNSNGTQRITRMTYPGDYAPGSGNPEAAALTAMQGAAHMHSEVIERWVTERTGGTEKVVQGELTTFKQYPSGHYRPFQRFVFNAPVAP
jgi:hypothetical protein